MEGLETQDVIRDLLLVSPRLAMHATVIHIHITNGFRRRFPTIVEYTQGLVHVPDAKHLMVVSKYTFFHETNRPLGNPLPYQCPGCKCVRTWDRIMNGSKSFGLDGSKFTCRKCGHTITYTPQRHQSQVILLSQGFWGTSSGNGKLVKKGSATGTGWLLSVTTESVNVAPVDTFPTSLSAAAAH